MIRNLFLLGFLLISVPSFAQRYIDIANLSPYTHYKTFETEHFRMIYQEGYFEFTERAAVHLEHAHQVLSPLLKWKPRGKTDILVADNEDDANGFTMPALRVGIVLIATPPDVYFSTSYSEDWIKLLTFHEYVHFLNIDPTTEWMELVRILFGDVIRPNGLWPVWMLEGLAVYYETRTSHLGRGRSPYYDAVVRSFYLDGRLGGSENRGITLDRVNGDYPYFPGGEVPYLFGYHLWNQFGSDPSVFTDTDKAIGEYSLRSSARIPYFIEGNLENVMHKNWSDYWKSFVQESNLRYADQVDKIRKSSVTNPELLTKTQYSAVLGAISPDGRFLAYTSSSLDDRSRLVLRNLQTGEERRLEEKMLGAGMGFTPDNRFLIYSRLVRTGTYYLYSDLFAYDVLRDKSTRLTWGLRAKDPSVSPDGKKVVFIQSVRGTHELKTLELNSNDSDITATGLQSILVPKNFSILGTPKFTRDTEVVFTEQAIGQSQSDIMQVSLSSKKASALLSDGNMNRYLSPSAHGDELYFVSDKSGVENVYRISKSAKSPVQVTNVLTDVQFPAVSSDGTLFGSYLTSDGFEIAKLRALSHPGATEKTATPSAPLTLADGLIEPNLHFPETSSRPYLPWSSLLPRQWAPVAYLTYGSDQGVSLGGLILGFDTTGKHQYLGLAGYNFKTSTFDGSAQYTYYGFRPAISLQGGISTTDIAADEAHAFYRRTSDISVSLDYPVEWTYASLHPSLYGFMRWNRIYEIGSNRPQPSNDFEYSKPLIPGFGASLLFSDSQATRLSFMPEQGNEIFLAAEDRINTGEFSVVKYLASYSHYFGFQNHSVLVPRARFLGSTHITGIDRSYARLEGRDTNDLFDRGQGISLNRIQLRGYGNTTIYTRQSAIASLDYHFPFARIFSGLGDTTPLFLKQAHGFVFAETAYIPSSRIRNLFLPSFGGGVSLDTTLLIRAPIRFNLEYQQGTRKDWGADSLVFFSIEGGSLF